MIAVFLVGLIVGASVAAASVEWMVHSDARADAFRRVVLHRMRVDQPLKFFSGGYFDAREDHLENDV